MIPPPPTTIVTGTRALSLHLPRSATDTVQGEIARSQSFNDEELLTHLKEHTQAGDLLVDIGAGIGNHAVFAAGCCGLHVACFESQDSDYQILNDNIALNGLQHLVTTQAVSIGPRTSVALAQVSGTNWNSPSAPDTPKELDRTDFPCPPRAIRIAQGGGELKVLRGAEKTIRRHHPLIYVEPQSVPDAIAIVQLLQDWGYSAPTKLGTSGTLCLVPTQETTRRSEPVSDVHAPSAATTPATISPQLAKPTPHSLETERRLSQLETMLSEQKDTVAKALATIPELMSFVQEQTQAARRLEAQVASLKLRLNPAPLAIETTPVVTAALAPARLRQWKSPKAPSNAKRKLLKLVRDPIGFFGDSKKPMFKSLRKLVAR